MGRLNDDDQDRARLAVARASSHQPGAGPEAVLSGQTRSVHGSGAPSTAETGNLWHEVLQGQSPGHAPSRCASAPPDRAHPGLHRWMSDPAAGLPAWIELRWPGAVAVDEVQVIFDTGLHRFLTLSQADGYTRKMLWGRPQPETVRNYTLEGETPSGWVVFASVTDNHQRRRVHRLPAQQRCTALRLTVLATQGIDHARVCELRVYGP